MQPPPGPLGYYEGSPPFSPPPMFPPFMYPPYFPPQYPSNMGYGGPPQMNSSTQQMPPMVPYNAAN